MQEVAAQLMGRGIDASQHCPALESQNRWKTTGIRQLAALGTCRPALWCQPGPLSDGGSLPKTLMSLRPQLPPASSSCPPVPIPKSSSPCWFQRPIHGENSAERGHQRCQAMCQTAGVTATPLSLGGRMFTTAASSAQRTPAPRPERGTSAAKRFSGHPQKHQLSLMLPPVGVTVSVPLVLEGPGEQDLTPLVLSAWATVSMGVRAHGAGSLGAAPFLHSCGSQNHRTS